MELSSDCDRKFHVFILIHDSCGNILSRVGGGTVSYTHLDVYKRQASLWARACATLKVPSAKFFHSETPSGPFPVSYTHLDVYKRQYVRLTQLMIHHTLYCGT